MATGTTTDTVSGGETQTAWRLRLAFGIILVGLGIFIAVMPSVAGSLIRIWLGVVLLAAGVAMTADAKAAGSFRNAFVTLGEAVGFFIVGLLLVLAPVGLTRLAVMFATLYGGVGLLRIGAALANRTEDRQQSLLTGFALLVVATLLITEWPSDAVWALGLLYGSGVAVVGLSVIVSALRGRPASEPAEETEPPESTFAEEQL
ncbi:HdeD family acid-resistance protein [Haloarchaeobius sp. DFWS5]|uniref:HdeD family acid-resistance protein n=1 Tax=Haloarchaeobius sp. DFWS5 TaxID=3446114 RepID=UPI003EB79F41